MYMSRASAQNAQRNVSFVKKFSQEILIHGTKTFAKMNLLTASIAMSSWSASSYRFTTLNALNSLWNVLLSPALGKLRENNRRSTKSAACKLRNFVWANVASKLRECICNATKKESGHMIATHIWKRNYLTQKLRLTTLETFRSIIRTSIRRSASQRNANCAKLIRSPNLYLDRNRATLTESGPI